LDQKILRAIMTQRTVSVPEAGAALGDLCENTSYAEAKRTGQIAGCPVIEVAGKKRVPTGPIRRVLRLEKAKSA
jgi:hypothetical protein